MRVALHRQRTFVQNLVSYITKLGYNELGEVWESNAQLRGECPVKGGECPVKGGECPVKGGECPVKGGEQRNHETRPYHRKHKTQL